MLKVALHYFSGSTVSHNLQSIYSLHREKKKKGNDQEKNFCSPLYLLIVLQATSKFISALQLPIVSLESLVCHFRKHLRCSCGFSDTNDIKWDKGKHHSLPTHTREFVLWIIYCIWFSFTADIFIAGVWDFKGWIKSHCVSQLLLLINSYMYS